MTRSGPRQSKISPPISLITRMFHEEMLPTKHTPMKLNQCPKPLSGFFLCLVGELLVHAVSQEIAAVKVFSKDATTLAYSSTDQDVRRLRRLTFGFFHSFVIFNRRGG